jgi:ADP-ribosyl-[dinitrogen reductase] hydrolase
MTGPGGQENPAIPDSYWVRPGWLLAGEYPGALKGAQAQRRVRRLLDAGVTFFLDLTEEGELKPYLPLLRDVADVPGRSVEHRRMPIWDMAVPTLEEVGGGQAMDKVMRDRARGCAVGAAVGDALGMPLEFGPRQSSDHLVREMRAGRLPAGTFTDDTEMALALAESLLAHCPLDPVDLARRFVAWYQAGPDDVGNHTRAVIFRLAAGEGWAQAAGAVQRQRPESAGNGSVMRCWPVALAHWGDMDRLLADSRLQSRVTHSHPECVAGSGFVNVAIYYLLQGIGSTKAVAQALDVLEVPGPLRAAIEAAPGRTREELENSGWVRHTLESAVWGLLTTGSFEEAVVQVVNLGRDADTAGAVVGALAGAAYGLEAIPVRWWEAVQGEWPLKSGTRWNMVGLTGLVDRLVGIS